MMRRALLFVVVCVVMTSLENMSVVASDPLAVFLDNGNLEIGYTSQSGQDCYLYWTAAPKKGTNRKFRNAFKVAEFRCSVTYGDKFKISKSGSGEYKLTSNGMNLYRFSNQPLFSSTSYIPGMSSEFMIKKQPSGLWSIEQGMYSLKDLDHGGNRVAMFLRAGRNPQGFWIKGSDCKRTRIEISPGEKIAVVSGVEVIGVTSSGTCSKGKHELSLGQTKDVTEEISVETSKEISHGWEVGVSVGVSVGFEVGGVTGEVSTEISASYSGSLTYGSATTKTTSTSNSQNSNHNALYNSPGGATIVGFITNYKIDKGSLPAKITVKCGNNYSYTYNSHVALHSKTYGHSFYHPYIGQFNKKTCTYKDVACLQQGNYDSIESLQQAGQVFEKCFSKGKGQVLRRRR